MTKTPLLRVLFESFKDPLMWVSIAMPIVFFYFIISSMPRGYQEAAYLVMYCIAFILFGILTRFELAIAKARMYQKSKDLDKMVKEVNELAKKVNASKSVKPEIHLSKNMQKDNKEFQ